MKVLVSCSKTGKNNKASYKTVLKWENEFGKKFDCDFHGKDALIRPGALPVKKDTIKIHYLSEPHKVTTNLEWKRKLGAQPYLESVIQDTPIGKAIKKYVKGKSTYRILFNSGYY